MKKGILICLLAVCLLTGCEKAPESVPDTETISTAAIMEDDQLVYVSLGDSIARGYGLSDIAGERFSTIAGQRWDAETVEVYNYGVDGQTSTELIEMLQNGGAEKLADADVISISIGANNVLRHSSQFLYDYYLYLYAEPPQYTEQEIAERFREFTDAADEGCLILEEDMPELLETLREINPDARILFLTLYNPYAAVNTELHINGLPVPLAPLADTYVQKINDCIRAGTENAENLTLVDVYTAFEGRTAELVYAATPEGQDPSELDLSVMDPHPNARGHLLIGRLVSDAYTAE